MNAKSDTFSDSDTGVNSDWPHQQQGIRHFLACPVLMAIGLNLSLGRPTFLSSGVVYAYTNLKNVLSFILNKCSVHLRV